MSTRSLAECCMELDAATMALAEARGQLDAARRVETTCLNRVGAAQAEFDEAAALVRKAHGLHGTDWHRRTAERLRA